MTRIARACWLSLLLCAAARAQKCNTYTNTISTSFCSGSVGTGKLCTGVRPSMGADDNNQGLGEVMRERFADAILTPRERPLQLKITQQSNELSEAKCLSDWGAVCESMNMGALNADACSASTYCQYARVQYPENECAADTDCPSSTKFYYCCDRLEDLVSRICSGYTAALFAARPKSVLCGTGDSCLGAGTHGTAAGPVDPRDPGTSSASTFVALLLPSVALALAASLKQQIGFF